MRGNYEVPAMQYMREKAKAIGVFADDDGCGAFVCPANACGINYCGGNACAGNACGVQLCPVDACPVDGCIIDVFIAAGAKQNLGPLPEQFAIIGKVDAKLLRAISEAPDSLSAIEVPKETIDRFRRTSALDEFTSKEIDQLLAATKRAQAHFRKAMKK